MSILLWFLLLSVRLDAWRIVGPGGGGAQFNPTICPSDPDRSIVTSDMTGGYITSDGGNSWRMFNLRGVIDYVVWDPRDSNRIYAKSIGLWQSADGGRTWRLLHPDTSKVAGLVTVGDHALQRILTADGSRDSVDALAVDPANSKLYAALSSPTGRAFYVSSDRGRHWERRGDLRSGPMQPLGNHSIKIVVDPNSPASDRTIYVIGANWVSVREGGRWTHHGAPQGVSIFTGVAAGFGSGARKPIIFAVTGRTWRGGENKPAAIYRTVDGGATWERTDSDLFAQAKGDTSRLQLRAIASSLKHPEVAYVSFRGLPVGSGPDNQLMGVAKTADAGRSWQFVWRDGERTPAPNIEDPWLNERFGPGWGENPFQLDVAVDNPDICLGTDFGRTMKTTDGGKNWRGVYARRAPGGGTASNGIDVSCSYSVHFDPFSQDRIFVSYTDIGLMVSEDGGTSWASATRHGVPREWVNSTYWVEFDPEAKGRVWAAMSGTHDLPLAKMWRPTKGDVSRFRGGVMTSEDGGRTWAPSDTGINQSAITHVLIDPSSPAGNRTLYAAALGKGIFKSSDNGRSWSQQNRGIEGSQPLAWRLTRTVDGTLYVVLVRRSWNGEIGDANDGAIYRSTDAAGTWEKLTLPDGCNGPMALVVDPKDPRRLAISAFGRQNPETGDTGGGIFLSVDGGRAWKHVLSEDQHIHDVTVDPRNGVYYACGFESSAYRSADRGETWTRIPGFNFKWGRRVVPDPRNPGMIFITTFGGGVWHGPAQGDPAAAEDIATDALRYRR